MLTIPSPFASAGSSSGEVPLVVDEDAEAVAEEPTGLFPALARDVAARPFVLDATKAVAITGRFAGVESELAPFIAALRDEPLLLNADCSRAIVRDAPPKTGLVPSPAAGPAKA